MWLWAAFIVLILSLLALDLGVFHRKAHAITLKGALALSGIWVSVALAFNVFVYFSYEYHWFGLDIPQHEPDGRMAAALFFAGYAVCLLYARSGHPHIVGWHHSLAHFRAACGKSGSAEAGKQKIAIEAVTGSRWRAA